MSELKPFSAAITNAYEIKKILVEVFVKAII